MEFLCCWRYDDETERREKYEGSRQQMINLFHIYEKMFYSFPVSTYTHMCAHVSSLHETYYTLKYNCLPFTFMLACDLSQIYSLISFYFLFYFFFYYIYFFNYNKGFSCFSLELLWQKLKKNVKHYFYVLFKYLLILTLAAI